MNISMFQMENVSFSLWDMTNQYLKRTVCFLMRYENRDISTGMSNSTVYTAVYTVQYTVTVQCFLEN